MLTSSVAPASASSDAGGPGSQMSSQTVSPTLRSSSSISAAAVAGLEVALLVEDAVVGQVHLAVDRVHAAAGEHRARVVDVVGELGKADQGHDPVGPGGDPVQRCACIGEEVLLEQEVLRRIPGDRELGKQDQLGARLAGLLQAGDDLPFVARDVADGHVELAERDLKRCRHALNYGTAAPRDRARRG